MKHGMSSNNARRVRLTGQQLKAEFLNKYSTNGLLRQDIILVQPVNDGDDRTITVKSGKNWQFRLGRILEVENEVARFEAQNRIIVFKEANTLTETLISKDFFKTYAFTSGLFVARKETKWQVYNSSDIISLILDHCSIRILSTGRIKIDFHDDGHTFKGLMTIEYRAEVHKQSWVFGAHGGGSGEKIRSLFEKHLLYTELSL